MGLYWGLSTAQGSGSKVHPKYILANTVSFHSSTQRAQYPSTEEYTLNYEGLHIMIEAIPQNETGIGLSGQTLVSRHPLARRLVALSLRPFCW